VTCGGRVTAEPCGRMIPARGPPSIAARSDDGNNRGISSGPAARRGTDRTPGCQV